MEKNISELPVINLSKKKSLPLPKDLIYTQKVSFERLLQLNTPPEKRLNIGLEAILRETFPIRSYDGSRCLEYVKYDICQPRYTPEECKLYGLTYGAPLKITLRLIANKIREEDVFFGEFPLMTEGGEFIINGVTRIIVQQLHRSPGVDFFETKVGDKRIYSCVIVPERGTWLEMKTTKKDTLIMRLDSARRVSVTTFLMAFSHLDFPTISHILRTFYKTQTVKVDPKNSRDIIGKISVNDIKSSITGEEILKAADVIKESHLNKLINEGVKEIEVISSVDDNLIYNTILDSNSRTYQEALEEIYQILRPGAPFSEQRAIQLIEARFSDPLRYRIGTVGRFRINRKLRSEIPSHIVTLQKEDLINCIKYIIGLRRDEGKVDDIDHLANRRVRGLDEIVCDEIRKGFLRLKKFIQERLNTLVSDADLSPKDLINIKFVTTAVEYVFSRGELSQLLDQTNILSQLTHQRRLSALGPGGLHRKRAGFEVRDIHPSHYCRICPVETPEGANIGLITSLSCYASIDEMGFITTPFYVVKDGRVTDQVVYLRADQEEGKIIAPYDTPLDEDGRIAEPFVLARVGDEIKYIPASAVNYMEVSCYQLPGISASLIAFLEHDDVNRALMGSNMQRQAVPLLKTEPPLVATGIEKDIVQNPSLVVVAKEDGVVKKVTASEIVINDTIYKLKKFILTNEKTCINQIPIVKVGQKVKAGDVIADGLGTSNGECALGKNLLVAYMPWEGYNFEDAIVVSERLLKDDIFTSIHIYEQEVDARILRQDKEEITRDIPDVDTPKLRNLDEQGVIRLGAWVTSGDILVGKVTPEVKREVSPEDKLLQALFGKKGANVKDTSLRVPAHMEGVVCRTEVFSRKLKLSKEEKARCNREIKRLQKEYYNKINLSISTALEEIENILGRPFVSKPPVYDKNINNLLELKGYFQEALKQVRGIKQLEQIQNVLHELYSRVEKLEVEMEKKIHLLQKGVDLPAGVLEKVKVWIASKENLRVGDKLAGRHGNKGVIAKILPEEDMPFMEDGTPVDIILNPLGVPSRMNLGQILETHLGYAAKKLGVRFIVPPFAGVSEKEIEEYMKKAGLPPDGKVTLYDGRTGEPFHQKVTVGYIYMMKLHHMVKDKIAARFTGPYSLVTQQPMGGRAKRGGQRLGEMEVWALEGYGAAYCVREMLTVKSDDIEGRKRILDAIRNNVNILVASTPQSFNVLLNELKGLCLNIKVLKGKELETYSYMDKSI